VIEKWPGDVGGFDDDICRLPCYRHGRRLRGAGVTVSQTTEMIFGPPHTHGQISAHGYRPKLLSLSLEVRTLCFRPNCCTFVDKIQCQCHWLSDGKSPIPSFLLLIHPHFISPTLSSVVTEFLCGNVVKAMLTSKRSDSPGSAFVVQWSFESRIGQSVW